jgi:8-oxo-dGTP pyrophosphatase MutT (NUDIX family)
MGYIENLRRQVGHQKLIMAGVRAIIRDDAGRVLLQQRSDFRTWGLPAGSMELDESIWEALCREVHEETGLTVIQARPYGIYSNPKYSTTYPNGDQAQPFTVAFVVEEWSGTPVPDGDESLQLEFFPLDALPPAENMHPPHRTALQDLRRYLKTGEIIVD